MLFILSKVSEIITQPLFWFSVLFGIGIFWLSLSTSTRQRRYSLIFILTMLLFLQFLGFRAVPDKILYSLERKFNPPKITDLDKHVGIIVLGGAIGHPNIYEAHGQIPLDDSAERMTIAIRLLKEFPKFKIVFSGGEGRLQKTGVSEAKLAKIFFEEQGINSDRIILETKSQTTRENIIEISKILGEQCLKPWILITSAWHMQRAMEEFSKSVCNITPYPVDYRTTGKFSFSDYSLAHSLVKWQLALHEWLGILIYKLLR